MIEKPAPMAAAMISSGAAASIIIMTRAELEAIERAAFKRGHMHGIEEATTPQHCHAGRDGDCNWPLCPQCKDGEPAKTGRHCPLDTRSDDD